MSKRMTKKERRAVERAAKKAAKKRPVLFLVIVLLIVAIVTCCVLHRKRIIHIPFLDGIIPQEKDANVEALGGAFTAEDIERIKTNDLSVHFLELGNEYTGDCTLIKTGDVEVLIDAGSRKGSAETIKKYLSVYCTDGTIEYVIATHAHQDHIAGFIGNTVEGERMGIFYSEYKVDTLIQFAQTEKTTTNDEGGLTLYGQYLEAVEVLKSKGTTVYTALECWNGGDATDGARKSFVLNEEKDIAMNILYQKYYEESAKENENNYSVCMMISEGEDNHYLFTGDLEKEGEASLIEENDLPKVRLFKAGHHGSYTANSAALMEVIQPEIVCVCCCCGSDEHGAKDENLFPSQKFTDNVSKYTDQIYVTSIAINDAPEGEKKYTSMNGIIVVLPKGDDVEVRCSNNATKFKDTQWYAQYRAPKEAA